MSQQKRNQLRVNYILYPAEEVSQKFPRFVAAPRRTTRTVFGFAPCVKTFAL